MNYFRNFLIITLVILIPSCSFPQSEEARPDILTYEEYMNQQIRLPYVLDIKKGNKHLIYYGAKHSFNPDDSMFIDIENRFNEFKPDIAFNEGGDDWPEINDRDSTIKLTGDPGYIRYISRKNNVPVISIEPSKNLEYEYLLSKYKKMDIALMYFCRQIEQLQHQKEITDDYFERYMNHFITGLKEQGLPLTDNEATLDYIVQYYEIFFQSEFNWREFDPIYYQPIFSKTLLNEIASESGYFRDRYMVDKIEEALMNYDKIFVVMGGSHLVIQEPVLRYVMNQYE